MKPKMYNTQRCPYARRTRIVLHEKGMDFEVHEIDLGTRNFWRSVPPARSR
jgi:glutathione S-transferase